MSYLIGIAIAVVVLIVFVFLAKIFVVLLAKKFAVSLAEKAVKNATQYAKDQIQTMKENKHEQDTPPLIKAASPPTPKGKETMTDMTDALPTAAVAEWIESNMNTLGESADFVILMTLAMGTKNPRTDVMEYLLKLRGNKAEDMGGCLDMAAMVGNVEAMEWLLANGPPNLANTTYGNDRGRTPLFAAAANGHIEAMKLLKKNFANVDAPDNDGQSPIFLAVSAGKTESIVCLAGLDANMNFKDRQGSTPLHYAVLANSVELVRCLMENGAKIDDKSPMTPMVYAISQGQVDILKCMVENQAKVRPIDIFAAAGEGQIKVLEYLKQHFADRWSEVVNADLGGMTPLLVAEGQGKPEAATWLRANGAR